MASSYGPGTIYATDGSCAEDVRRRRVPLIGKGTGVFSFIHVDDAAAATVATMESSHAGVFNVVGNEPSPALDWLPRYAEILEAPPPFRVPRLVGRLAGGPYAIYLMVQQRGASNAKARKTLDWRPAHSSWRDGFQTELA